jgi:superfamily I DNA/RNA helicase
MNGQVFKPTPEQDNFIHHVGSAFITACPGAGKTRVIVERVRHLLRENYDGRGVALLSFSRATISELENRLRGEALLSSPVFPHFIGTFDSFIWQFVVAPFGIPNTETAPRLIPDMGSRKVQPFDMAQALPLACYDRITGKINAAAALRSGFDVSKKTQAQIRAYETSAQNMLARFHERGELDFDDVRNLVLNRLADKYFSVDFSSALAARFIEVIIDEAQDCNPVDLKIISWLRSAGIPTKVVCDPHQSIYGFRGGVADQLFTFANTFDKNDQLKMCGNFRSSDNICKAIVMLRAAEYRKIIDKPLGKYKNEKAHVYILSYAGASVSPAIGEKFVEILNELKVDVTNAPVLAATKSSGSNATGQRVVKAKRDLTFRLAQAVSDFYFAFESGNQKSALEEVHKVILELDGRLSIKSYHQCIVTLDIKPNEWRPQALHVLRALRYDPKVFADADAWHSRAKEILEPYLPEGSPSISQKLKKNRDIKAALTPAPAKCPPVKTIHSAKGMEFPAVCVVTVPQTLKSVLDYLEHGTPAEEAETARELYVAASRAQRLLVIATPKSQTSRLATHLRMAGAAVTILDI